MSLINYNGKTIAADTALIPAQNRGLRYGDGLFETILFNNGTLQLWQEHAERLWKGMQMMAFDIPPSFTKEQLQQAAIDLAKKNNHTRASIRINIIRGNGGVFDPQNMQPICIIESRLLATPYLINSNGLQLCLYASASKTCDAFSNLKHNNYLPYTMAAIYAKEQQCNDAVVLNQHGRICDTCIANIFFIKNAEIFTPALTEGCVAGTMRAYLIKQLPALGYTIHEAYFTKDDLLKADEVFLTNAISPIRWAGSFNEVQYGNKNILKIYGALQSMLPDYF